METIFRGLANLSTWVPLFKEPTLTKYKYPRREQAGWKFHFLNYTLTKKKCRAHTLGAVAPPSQYGLQYVVLRQWLCTDTTKRYSVSKEQIEIEAWCADPFARAGGIIVTKDFLEAMGNPDANMQGTITSLYDVGCFFGAVSGSSIGSWLGAENRSFGAPW